MFDSSKFQYISPAFLPILGKRKLLTWLVSPIIKLAQKELGFDILSGPNHAQRVMEIEQFGAFFGNIHSVLHSLILQKKMELKKIFGIPGNNADLPGAHDQNGCNTAPGDVKCQLHRAAAASGFDLTARRLSSSHFPLERSANRSNQEFFCVSFVQLGKTSKQLQLQRYSSYIETIYLDRDFYETEIIFRF